MGTSSSYSGSGGKPGNQLRNDVLDWLEQLPDTPSDEPAPNRLDPNLLLNVIPLIRPSSASGGGGGGAGGSGGGGSGGSRSGGGPRRTAGASAGTAGRAAAAAYAFATGDAAGLAELGLDFAELSALDDPGEVARRIVEAACGPRQRSIEDHEQRLVAAEVAEWVLEQSAGENPPSAEEVSRHAIALIIADAVMVETAKATTKLGKSGIAESEIREAAEALAARATFSATGVTETAFKDAIEQGIEAFRDILKGAG